MIDDNFELSQMDDETEEMLNLRYLTKKNASFSRTKGGFLSLTFDGTQYDRVHVVRMFPFTDPNDYISIRTTGEQSKEIGVIEHMKDFDAETQTMLTEQLALRYFTPVIRKIKQIRDEYGYAYFDVVTDHGECRFTIHMGGNSVVHLSDTRIMIFDLDENRFEIPDILALSPSERKKLDLFL